ncbi:DNA polymerase phi-domain-containing protein [Thamnocephalis sphaerospora]|uniref:DNA polymerase phi-domain-containing protein n=1 Tax=Thamnocephalis sphaerospora TaxID=78915 RepID=A0A4P9XNN8_9FUNG|nr:DNA polymerase phi-domain-containing protein [Thamnocephalis sphaerospora]|eukprot:RKP07584.1 DNA polymerase phi-domain-containing protein [Thamnocephalis sphaerospora]
MSATLPLFWDLASLDAEKREVAAESLIATLVEAQRTHRATLDDDAWQALLQETDEETTEHLEQQCADDVLYALKRLVRGLPSPRQGARQGFALALTELLASLDFLSVKTLVDMIMAETATNSNMSGQEERDMLFGRVFGFMGVARSGALRRESTSDDDVLFIVGQLIDYGKSKQFLREAGHHVLRAMVAEVKARKEGSKLLREMAAQVLVDGMLTPDALLFALALEEEGEMDVYTYTPAWKKPYVQPDNLKQLAVVMRESSVDGQTELHSVWHPHLHSVWEQIMPQLYGECDEEDEQENGDGDKSVARPVRSSAVPFDRLWKVLVDDSLFGEGSSHERKFWGFLLVQRAMQYLPAAQLPVVFTRNMMNSLMNNLASQDRYLHSCALTTVSAMVAAGEEDQEKRVAVLLRLIGEQGDANFDRITGTKTVEMLLRGMDATGLLSYAQYLLRRFADQTKAASGESDAEEQKRVAATHRQWALDQLAAVARNPSAKEDDAVLSLIEDALMLHGYLEPQDSAPKATIERIGGVVEPSLTTETRQLCRQKLTTMLVNMNPNGSAGKEDRKEASAASPRMVHAAKRFGKLLEGEEYALADDIDDDALSGTESALATLARIDERIKSAAKAAKPEDTHLLQKLRAFQILFAHFVFETLTNPAEYGPLVDDMSTCFDKLFPSKKAAKKSAKGGKKAVVAEEADGEEPVAVEVLVDAVLSIASKPPAPLREISKQVFAAFCEDLTQNAFFLVLKALQGDQDLPDADDAMEVDEDGDGDEDAQGSNDEQDEAEAASDNSDAAEDEEDDSELDSDLEYDPSDDEEGGFALSREQIRKALGAAAYGSDEEESDEMDDGRKKTAKTADSDDDENESLGDDQMAAFDRALEAMFRERKAAKAEKKRAAEAAISFKLRVLDLIELFVRKQPRSPLVFEVIVPVLDAMRTEAQVERRGTGLLTQRICKLKDPVLGVDKDNLHGIAEAVIEIARKSGTSEFQSMCGKLLAQLVRTLIAQQDMDALDRLMLVYGAALERFCTDKNTHLTEDVFTELIRRYPLAGWRLASGIAGLIESGTVVKTYRLTRLFGMLTLLAQSTPKGNAECEQHLVAAVPEIARALLAEIDRLLAGEALAARAKEVVKCLQSLVRRTSSVVQDVDALAKLWQASAFAERLNTLASAVPGQAVRSVAAQVLRMLGQDDGAASKAPKRKRDTDTSQSEAVAAESFKNKESAKSDAATDVTNTEKSSSQKSKTKKDKKDKKQKRM